MKPKTNLENKGRPSKSLIVILFLMLAMCCMSCSKEETTIKVKWHFYGTSTGETKETALKYRDSIIADYAVIVTDKGTFNLSVTKFENFNYHSEWMYIEPGDYLIKEITLYDKEGNPTHYAEDYSRNEDGGDIIVTRTGETWPLTKDGWEIPFQIFFIGGDHYKLLNH